MPREMTPSQRRAKIVQGDKWDRENTRQVKLKLNLRSDADILAQLDAQQNRQGYIKRLIREDIARSAQPDREE